MASKIIFEVREDGGFTASALGHDIFTEAESLEELRANVRSAVQYHFGDGVPGPLPGLIRLQRIKL
jgi:predicted RNase H-like HicB family nuclease